MGKGKNTATDLFLIDRYQMGFRGRPLFGLNKLVKLTHRKRNGILYCENVMCISETITFSKHNTRTVLYTISHGSPNHAGVYGEPRLGAPNEASAADRQRFYDDGTEVVFHFTPQPGKTFSIDSEMYKTHDPGHHYASATLPAYARIARFELTLDVTAYLRTGFSDLGWSPLFQFERAGSKDKRGHTVRARARILAASEERPGWWKWNVDNAAGGTFRLIWVCFVQPRAAKSVNLEKVIAELGVNSRLAKDLHNFVTICHYYAAGFRSLNTIAPEMITHKSVLKRSLECLEGMIGAELIHRTKGRGLARITPSGEAVLEWWSQFYMKWTPISQMPSGPKRVREPAQRC